MKAPKLCAIKQLDESQGADRIYMLSNYRASWRHLIHAVTSGKVFMMLTKSNVCLAFHIPKTCQRKPGWEFVYVDVCVCVGTFYGNYFFKRSRLWELQYMDRIVFIFFIFHFTNHLYHLHTVPMSEIFAQTFPLTAILIVLNEPGV